MLLDALSARKVPLGGVSGTCLEKHGERVCDQNTRKYIRQVVSKIYNICENFEMHGESILKFCGNYSTTRAKTGIAKIVHPKQKQKCCFPCQMNGNCRLVGVDH